MPDKVKDSADVDLEGLIGDLGSFLSSTGMK
jgi:hypothetical protein